MEGLALRRMSLKLLTPHLVVATILVTSFYCTEDESSVGDLFRQARITSDESLMLKAYVLARHHFSQNPGDVNACIWKGKLENSIHAFEFSEATFKECYRLKPDPEIKGLLSEVYIHQGKLDEAREALRSSSRSSIRFMYFARQAMLEKVEGFFEKSHKSWDLALEAYDRIDPEPPAWALVEIADLYRLQGRRGDAIANYRKSLSLVNNYGPALQGLKSIQPASREAQLENKNNSFNQLVNTGS